MSQISPAYKCPKGLNFSWMARGMFQLKGLAVFARGTALLALSSTVVIGSALTSRMGTAFTGPVLLVPSLATYLSS